MTDEAEVTKQVSAEMERMVAQTARHRANATKWDRDIAVFLFAILAIVIILLFQGIVIEIVAPVAAFGLAMGWLMGWRKVKQVYKRFYDEEVSKLAQAILEETIEEKVQKALRERWG